MVLVASALGEPPEELSLPATLLTTLLQDKRKLKVNKQTLASENLCQTTTCPLKTFGLSSEKI
jgi:hypothetical protein